MNDRGILRYVVAGVSLALLACALVLAASVDLPLWLVVAVSCVGTALQIAILWLQTPTPGAPIQGERGKFVSQLESQVKGAKRTVLYDGDFGLYQQWYFELRLKEESARCVRYGLSMAVIVVKMSHVVDSVVAEDAWQRQASQAAYTTAKSIRTVDLAASLGASEFAICLVHCNHEGADVAVGRLVKALRNYEPLIGVALFPEDKLEPRLLIERARERANVRVLAETTRT